MNDRLEEYRSKRDPMKTPEPRGGDASPPSGAPRFVIQHHRASSEHYDLRLEIDGVLVSWAVPKGPSTDPRERRLAVRTEDHPIDYLDFEGTIPSDEYGGGSVIVWDIGTWQNLTTDEDEPVAPADAVDQGHLSFSVEGEKLSGGYTLHRVGDDWLLIKHDDGEADARRRPTSTQPESVITGNTVDEVAATASSDRDAPGDDES